MRTAPAAADLAAVFPGADRFSDRRGRPPVFEAYRMNEASGREQLVGYAFLTSDVPPEMTGYSGAIEVLVGMDLAGALTGLRVMEYHESLRETRGDFLAGVGFQEQFAGKAIGDPFRVRGDLDGISGATITVRAVALGVRNAARRIAAEYMAGGRRRSAPSRPYIATATADELEPLSWDGMLDVGLAGQLTTGDVTISLVYVRDDAMGELLIGPEAFRRAVAKAGERVHEHHVMILGIDGTRARGPLPRVFFVQGSDTLRARQDDFVDAGLTEGKLEGAFLRPGLLLVDRSLDVSVPFRIGLGRCCGQPSVWADYLVQEPVPAAAPTRAAGGAIPSAGEPPAPQPTGQSSPSAAAEPGPAASSAPVPSETPAGADRGSAVAAPAPRGTPPWMRLVLIFALTTLAIASVALLAASARRRGAARPRPRPGASR